MNMHSNHRLLFGTIFVGFLLLSLAIAVGPAIWVEGNMVPVAPGQELSELEKEGLKVYIAEGCVACHSQQVRPIAMDEPWGRPSVPADYAAFGPLGAMSPYAPAVLGTSRTGPDLTNVGARQASEVWQHLHLYNPRTVVPDSIMPSYPWLYEVVAEAGPDDTVVPVSGAHAPEGGQVVTTQKADALVAYLLALRQPQITGSGHE